jgi:hypothetical protein
MSNDRVSLVEETSLNLLNFITFAMSSQRSKTFNLVYQTFNFM